MQKPRSSFEASSLEGCGIYHRVNESLHFLYYYENHELRKLCIFFIIKKCVLCMHCEVHDFYQKDQEPRNVCICKIANNSFAFNVIFFVYFALLTISMVYTEC